MQTWLGLKIIVRCFQKTWNVPNIPRALTSVSSGRKRPETRMWVGKGTDGSLFTSKHPEQPPQFGHRLGRKSLFKMQLISILEEIHCCLQLTLKCTKIQYRLRFARKMTLDQNVKSKSSTMAQSRWLVHYKNLSDFL